MALLYLALGFTLGGLLLINKGLRLHPAVWSLLPGHIEFLFLGWTAQLALGVAFWILPRFSTSPKRGDVALAWFAVVLLNLGIWIVTLAPWIPGPVPAGVIGRVLELTTAVLFSLHAWPRTKAFRA
jgi:hypothetical protein